MKAGFKKPKMRKMSEKDFVDKLGHCGCRNPNCWICFLVDGVPRRFMKIVDRFRDERPAYKFHMATITYSERSMEGCKYETVLRCKSSHYLISFYLRLKSDWSSFEPSWFTSERIICFIKMDNDGVWSYVCENWTMFKEEFGIDCQYVPKDDDRDAATAESTCRIVESMTEKNLIRMNLSARWWMLASKAGKWLLNRLPTHSDTALSSPDEDRPPPLELFQEQGRHQEGAVGILTPWHSDTGAQEAGWLTGQYI